MQRILGFRVPGGLLMAVLGLCLALPSHSAEVVADTQTASDSLRFEVLRANAGATLTVSGPAGSHWKLGFEQGEAPVFFIRDASDQPLEDGSYTYELRLTPVLDAGAKAELQRARRTGDMTGVQALRSSGRLPQEAAAVFGSFTIDEGRILDPRQEEQLSSGLETRTPTTARGLPGGGSGDGLTNVSAYDLVVSDDLIVDGSACIGFDCVNGETFGFDTVRLKENSLRIHFDDTSGAPFPDNDWRLIANDSTSGGLEKFSIEDASNGRTPFTIEARARSHSLYVDDGGRVGLGTSTPSVELHVLSGSTPTLRLEQNASGGFAPQVWDVAGNETNFFIRDSTNGSTLPFRIFPDENSGALVLRNHRVGIGTSSPTDALHLRRTDGSAVFLLEEASSTEAVRTVVNLKNNGRLILQMEDTSANGQIWKFRTVETQFNIDTDSSPGNEVVISQAGNMTILGTLTENSNREAKTNIEAIDPDEVLRKVAQLPLSTWTYKKEQDVEHLGPMAQDFHEAFGLGASNVGITTYDTAGVALASVQALHRRLLEEEQATQRKNAELEELKQMNSELLRRLEALEQRQ